jgi:nucleoside-diphosphate-sugar epimerase
LGRYLRDAISQAGLSGHALVSRLEDQDALSVELRDVPSVSDVTFVHLAARVSVPACEADPDGAYRTNVSDALRTLETVSAWARDRGAPLNAILVSTGHVYAAAEVGRRLDEASGVAPRSVYASTKLAAERLLCKMASDTGTPLLIARVFGLVAPRQAPNYLLPSLIHRVRTGDVGAIPGLDSVRDYLDARDVCADLMALALVPVWGNQVVNVCSGTGVSIRDVLACVAAEVDPKHADQLMHRATAGKSRPDDIPWLVGDPTRFRAMTRTDPQRITLTDSVAAAVAESGS